MQSSLLLWRMRRAVRNHKDRLCHLVAESISLIWLGRLAHGLKDYEMIPFVARICPIVFLIFVFVVFCPYMNNILGSLNS